MINFTSALLFRPFDECIDSDISMFNMVRFETVYCFHYDKCTMQGHWLDLDECLCMSVCICMWV